MVVLSLDIRKFGKFQNRIITLRDGVNVITGGNDSGKTTIAAFIKGILYGMKPDTEEYRHFLPAAADDVYGGSMRVEIAGTAYDIGRNFLIGHEHTFVTSAVEGREISDPENWIHRMLCGVAEEEYMQYGFLSQISLTEADRPCETAAEAVCEVSAENAEAVNTETEAAEKDEETLQKQAAERGWYDDAKNYLIRLRKEAEEKLPAGSTEESEDVDGKLRELSAKITEFEEGLIPNIDKDIAASEAGLQTAIEEAKKKQKKELVEAKREMLVKKETLARFDYEQEVGNVSAKNHLGIALLVGGVIAAVVSFFLKSSYDVESSMTMHTIVLGIFGLAAALFIAGIILTVISIFRRKNSLKLFEKQAEIRKEADEKEETYDRMLSADEANLLPDKIEREARIDALKKTKLLYVTELDTLKQYESELLEQKTKIMDTLAGIRELRKNMDALDAGIAAFEVMSKGGTSDNESEAPAAIEALQTEKAEEDAGVLAEAKAEPEVPDVAFLSAKLSEKLAAADSYDPMKALPIILDDVFEDFDEAEIAKIMTSIRALGRQVIILSARPVEKKAK